MGEVGVWKSRCLTYTASEEVGQGNDMRNSLFPLLFFLFLSSFRAASNLLPSPSAVKCVGFSPESFAVFSPPLAATEALPCFGDSVAEASGASEATSRSWRWGWGGEKLRELPAGGGRLSPPPPGAPTAPR